MTWMGRMRWTGSLVFVVATGAGALLAGRPASAQPEVRLAAAPAAGQLEAELEVTGIRSTDDGETAVLELALAHGFAGDARATYAFEVRDDRGRLVGAKQRVTPFALGKGRARAIELQTGVLPDGFYRATVTVAAKPKDRSRGALATPEVYFESRGGQLTPLEFSDFADRSAYNAGVVQ